MSKLIRVALLLGRFISHRITRYVAAWIVLLSFAAYAQHKAIHSFDSRDPDPQKHRRDGNNGHTSIDFGGQWMMGRMLVLGKGRHLYDRHHLYEIAQQSFPREDEAPEAAQHDADELMAAILDTELDEKAQPQRERRSRITLGSFGAPFMGYSPLETTTLLTVLHSERWTRPYLYELEHKHVGGALYPPTQALFLAPLGMLPPRQAYHLNQWIMLLSGFAAGLGVSVLTRGRIWWSVATFMIMVYPGFNGGHELGQNAPLSLAILVWGWALIARGKLTGGGLVWGLFAFKPVWAAAFLLVAILTRRWRTAFGMCLVGICFILATLPFVGVETWFDWLKVGSIANRLYDVDSNWIPLSRDLHGIVRRLLIDIDDPYTYFERDRWYAHVAGWALWLIVLETTVRLTQLYPDRARAVTGPAACFILLAGWMSCYRFMYYDALLSALGFLALLDPPKQLVRPKLVTFSPPGEKPLQDPDYYWPRFARIHPGPAAQSGRTWVANSLLIYVGIALLVIQHTLPFLDLKMTITGRHHPPRPALYQGEPVVKDGQTVMRTPSIQISTDTSGPAWETLLLLGLWGWCGVRFALEAQSLPPDQEATTAG